MAIRITAGQTAQSTKVVDVETGIEIKGIRQITLAVRPGGVWEARLTLGAQQVDVTAVPLEILREIDVTQHGGGHG